MAEISRQHRAEQEVILLEVEKKHDAEINRKDLEIFNLKMEFEECR